MTRRILRAAVGIALACTTGVIIISLHACSEKPTTPEQDPEELIRRGFCEDYPFSQDELVIDFRDTVSLATVEALAARHALSVVDTIKGGNSYLVRIDRSRVPSVVTAHIACSSLWNVYRDIILFIEPAMYGWMQGDSWRSESFMSTERALVLFREKPSQGVVDSFAGRWGLLRYWPEVSLEYVQRLIRKFDPERTFFFRVDRRVVPEKTHVNCLGYLVAQNESDFALIELMGPIERHYRTVLLEKP